MATYSDLIAGALRLVGIIGDGETPSTDQTNNALFSLNEMLDAWNSDGLMIFTTAFYEYALTTSQTYTVGPGANFNISVRPSEIRGAWIRQNASSANPIDLPMSILSSQEWGDIRSKTVQSNIPRFVYMDGNWPTATVYVWPKPDGSDTKLILSFDVPLTEPVLTSDTENLPPSYRQAIRFNLACLIAAEYGREASPTTQNYAYMSKNLIAQNNQQIDRLDFDSEIQGVKGGRYWIVDDMTR